MRTVDLFSGCGGFSLGFQQAGFDIVAAFDNWKSAIDIYRDNFTHPIFNQVRRSE
jgi:DNA (cytosine-5)-methyltransferase 1